MPEVALAIAVVAFAVWRAACVVAGPDVDTDAYAHHMIARAILADPRDLAVHWVWLPLFHYLEVPLVALGGTMNDVRWANVLLSAATPVVLFFYVRRSASRARAHERERALSADATALLAAVFAAACPIAMQMGTTAQSEPLFALLALSIAIAYERRRTATAAALLGAAVLLRYEAWAILATAFVVTVFEETRRDRAKPPPRRWLVVAVPLALIFAWAALRRPVDGRWFGFLGDTHAFASRAVADKGGSLGAIGLARDALYYPAFVAVRVFGPVALLAPFGVARTWRDQGARFVLVLASCLGFVSLTWIRRSSLGLDRHFVVMVPLYAAFGAHGVSVVAEALSRAASRVSRATRATRAIREWGAGSAAPWATRAGAVVFGLGSVAGLGVMLHVWMGFWRASIDRGWPERTALGAYLRSLPDDAPIFCDDATLEILSGLDRRRFDRRWVDDPDTWDGIGRVARARGVAYVATWRRKLGGHEAAGPIVFQASPPTNPAAAVAVMRVSGDSDRAAR